MCGNRGGRHCPCPALNLTTAWACVDEVVNLLLGKANPLEHCAVQIGMRFTVKPHVCVEERIVSAGIIPIGGTVGWGNKMDVDVPVPISRTTENLLVGSTARADHFVCVMALDGSSKSLCFHPFSVRNVPVV